MLYRINGWDEHFETAKSRKVNLKSWSSVPNKFGLGYRTLVEGREDGPAIYGCFVAVALYLSRHPVECRHGYLASTAVSPEYPHGIPMSPEQIAMMTHMPIDLVQKMLKICSNPEIGWLSMLEDTTRIPQGYREDTASPHGIPIGEGGEEKRGEERDAKQQEPEPHPKKSKGKKRKGTDSGETETEAAPEDGNALITGQTIIGWWIDAHVAAEKTKPVISEKEAGSAKEMAKWANKAGLGKNPVKWAMWDFLHDPDPFLDTNRTLAFLRGRAGMYIDKRNREAREDARLYPWTEEDQALEDRIAAGEAGAECPPK